MDRPSLEQRVQASQPSLTLKLERWVNRGVDWLMAHWAGAVNALFLLYVGLPLLAPLFMGSFDEGSMCSTHSLASRYLSSFIRTYPLFIQASL